MKSPTWEKECNDADLCYNDSYYRKCKFCGADLKHGSKFLNKWNKYYSCDSSIYGTGNYVEYIKKCTSKNDIRRNKLKKIHDKILDS